MVGRFRRDDRRERGAVLAGGPLVALFAPRGRGGGAERHCRGPHRHGRGTRLGLFDLRLGCRSAGVSRLLRLPDGQ